MSTTRVCVVAAIGTAALLGCATKKAFDMQALEQARTEVQSFSNNPMASELASRDFSASRTSLMQAEDALKAKNQEDVDYYSYLALRQARTGEARISEYNARRQLERGQGERERLLLEARNKELEAQSKLAAQQTPRGMVLTLSGVLFDTGKATLKPGAAPTLDRVASYMAEYPKTMLIVEGHTDSQGSHATNQALSASRAQAVADALVVRGIPRERIDLVGRGPDMPVASNDTPEGRHQNRRVEMVFSDGSGRFAEGARGVIR
jgi:outer membrane protein OmpA-like peptidoglycan-associated protein